MWLQYCKFNEIRLNDIRFSNLLKYFPHRHACITIFLGLNQLTSFAMLQGFRNATTIKMGYFATIVNGWKPLTIIGNCSILVMVEFMNLFLTMNSRVTVAFINKHGQIREYFERNLIEITINRKVVFSFLSYLNL